MYILNSLPKLRIHLTDCPCPFSTPKKFEYVIDLLVYLLCSNAIEKLNHVMFGGKMFLDASADIVSPPFVQCLS